MFVIQTNIVLDQKENFHKIDWKFSQSYACSIAIAKIEAIVAFPSLPYSESINKFFIGTFKLRAIANLRLKTIDF